MREGEAGRSAAERRRERNRRDYERSKAAGEHVLLRLDAGGIASLDGAARAAALSRAAFARMCLPALLDAFAGRYPAMEAARASRRLSLSRFLAAAIDEAIAGAAQPDGQAKPSAASEFDALFS